MELKSKTSQIDIMSMKKEEKNKTIIELLTTSMPAEKIDKRASIKNYP